MAGLAVQFTSTTGVIRVISASEPSLEASSLASSSAFEDVPSEDASSDVALVRGTSAEVKNNMKSRMAPVEPRLGWKVAFMPTKSALLYISTFPSCSMKNHRTKRVFAGAWSLKNNSIETNSEPTALTR